MSPPARKHPHFRTIALIIGTAMFMEQLDGTVLATALPIMSRDLGVDVTSMSIALTSYLVSLAIFIPASGWVADRYGSRSVLMAAMIAFAAASLLCAQATSLAFLAIARFVQGAAGAMMLPVGRLVLLRSIEKRNMVSAMSWVLVPALVGPILGPLVGGFFVTYLNWRWIFYINVPIAILGAVLVGRYIGQFYGEAEEPLDRKGMLLSGISLASLLFGFELSSHRGEMEIAVALWVAGLIAGMAYLAHARRTKSPILDMSLLRVRTFRTSLLAGSILRITQGAQPYLLPLMLQLGFGMTALQSGSLTLATAIGAFVMKAIAPQVLRHFGFRDSMIVNGVFAAGCYGICAFFRPGWPLAAIFGVLALSGFFMSFQFTAYNTIVYDEVDPRRVSSATSFYSTFQQLMLSMGVCTAAAALSAAMWLHGNATPALPDFSVAFGVVVSVSLLATFYNLRFRAGDGVDYSGHTPRSWSLRQALRDLRGLNP